MKQTLVTLVLALSLAACASEAPLSESQSRPSPPIPSLPAPSKSIEVVNAQSFESWLLDFLAEAKKKGIQDQTIQLAMPYLKLNQRVLEFDKQQPEFTQTFWTYLEKRLSLVRVQAGKIALFANQRALQDIEAKIGVPAPILVAFWGLETNYGHYLGDFSTIEALTTLAFDPRRSSFFRKELMATLQILQAGDVTASQMRGSWAGAIGQMQFMPSVYVKYAIDGDGDQHINLWQNSIDALTSAANYLQASGWQTKQPWLQRVQLPSDFDYSKADGKTEYSLQDIERLGIKPYKDNWLATDLPVQLLLPAGYEGPAFVTWPNFRVIKRWNHSNNYALAVGLLAQQFLNMGEASIPYPKNNKPWSRQFIIDLQQKLMDLGFDVGGADGWFGNKSSQALRTYQQQKNLPADGYPNKATIEALQLKID